VIFKIVFLFNDSKFSWLEFSTHFEVVLVGSNVVSESAGKAEAGKTVFKFRRKLAYCYLVATLGNLESLGSRGDNEAFWHYVVASNRTFRNFFS
jgi:hypothetical protein